MTQSIKSVLVLGANGRFGRHAALAFASAGWRVHAHIRASKQFVPELAKHPRISAAKFDLDGGALTAIANKCSVIVNGLHPPYAKWATAVPMLTSMVLSLARSSGATVLIPGNVYVFGAAMPELLTASTPHNPTNQLGEIRRDMEQSYRQAADEGVQTIILRIGDFLQRDSTGNWFDTHMTGGLSKGRFAYPGRRDIPHAFGYLPDVGRACVGLAEIRTNLPAFADIPFEGTTLSGNEMHTLIEQTLGRSLRKGQIPWPIIRLLALFNKDMRGVIDMRYLWETPHQLSGQELRHWLPEFQPTPVEQIMADCVSRWMPDEPRQATLHQALAVRN